MSRRLTLFVLRHGEPEDPQLVYGQHDVRLSERGRAQVKAQVRALADRKIDGVLASDLTRVRIGAEAVATAHGVTARLLPDLREMHLGVLEGLTRGEALRRHPELAGRAYRDMLEYRFPGGGESVLDVASRAVPPVVDAVRAAVDDAPSKPRTLVVYTHNTVVRILVAMAAGLGPAGYIRFKQAFGSWSRIDFDDAFDPADPWASSIVVWSNRDPSSMPQI